MKRVLKAFAFATAIVVALVSCKKEDQPKEVALTGIELNATSQTLQVGQEFQLTVTYKPENATTKPAATWASDAPAVATVDGGKVVAVAAGTAKITATVGSFTAECAITVASAEEEILPVEGNSAWSVIGALLGKSWDTDFVCAEENGAFVLKNVKLAKGNEIKFRKDKAWDVNRGINKENEAAELAAGTPTKAIQGGGNIIIPADGIYDLYYFAEKEAIVYVAKDASLPEIPNFAEETPTDFTSPDWASIPAITNGNHTFKFTMDDKNAYFYTERSTEGRYSELWGAGKGYIYFAFDFDGDLTTGEELNGNGKYEYIAYIYCFGGTADAPVIEITADGGVAPSSYTVANVIAKGTADANGAKVEYCVPLADLPELPEEFTIYTWGNKDLAKVEYPVPPVQKAVEMDWDYTPSAAYLADTNLWKAADADNTITFLYHPNWADPTVEPTAEFKESTYVLTLMDADAGNAYSGQMIITPTNDVIVDPAKTYNFSCTIGSSTGTSVWIKMHQPGVNWPEVFETAGAEAVAERIAIAAGETKEIKIEGIKSMYEEALPQEILFDFAPHSALNTIYIKDIILEEVGGGTPSDDEKVLTLTKDMFPSAYPTEEAVMTIPTGEKFYLLNVAHYLDYGNDIQIKKNGGYIANRTSFGKIKSIKVTCQADKTWYPTNLALYAGSAEKPADNAITATSNDNSSTYDLSAGDYQYFNLVNTSGYAVYLSEIVITYTGDAVTPEDPAPAGITLDGNLSDWDAVEGVEAGSFKEFKFASDANNIYMYFKIKRSNIIAAKTEPFVFNWRRYIAFGIDSDNNSSTGTAVTFAGMNIPGCEIGGNFYPFRGTATSASGTDNVEIVNGVEEQGGVTTEIGSSVPDGAADKVSAYGQVDDDYVYVEAGFARSAVGSPAAGTIKIQLSLAWDLTDILEYTLN